MKPSPPEPNTAPSLSASPAFLVKSVTSSSWGRRNSRQSSQTRKEAWGWYTLDKPDVVHDVVTHLLQPFGSIGISGDGRRIGEDGSRIEFARLEKTVEAFPYNLIRHDGIGGDDLGAMKVMLLLAASWETEANGRCLYCGKAISA